MKFLELRFFEPPHEEQTVSGLHESSIMQLLDMVIPMVTESVYMLDLSNGKFSFIRPHDIFLCGYSVEDALRMGYSFFPQIVCRTDLPLWEKIFEAIVQYVHDCEQKGDTVDHFSCTFRLQRKYADGSCHIPHMVYCRIKHVWHNGILRYLIGFVGNSNARETGNLRMYHKNGLTYKQYCFMSRRWKQIAIEPLTERERDILMLSQQGKSTKVIAELLCRTHHTIRNQITALFQKLEVNSMQEAIDLTNNHRMLYVPKRDITDAAQSLIESTIKQSRIKRSHDKLQRIQKHLDNGKSNRHAAMLEDVPESTIRTWIKKGILKKQSNHKQ